MHAGTMVSVKLVKNVVKEYTNCPQTYEHALTTKASRKQHEINN